MYLLQGLDVHTFEAPQCTAFAEPQAPAQWNAHPKVFSLKSFVMPHMLSLRDAGCEHYSLIIPRLRPCILHGIQWFSVHIHYQMHGIPSQNLQAILGCSSAIYNATGSKSQL